MRIQAWISIVSKPSLKGEDSGACLENLLIDNVLKISIFILAKLVRFTKKRPSDLLFLFCKPQSFVLQTHNCIAECLNIRAAAAFANRCTKTIGSPCKALLQLADGSAFQSFFTSLETCQPFSQQRATGHLARAQSIAPQHS